MYKVFVNNKPLYLSNHKIDTERIIPFQTSAEFDVAFDLLKHSAKDVTIYHKDLDFLWNKFKEHTQQIYAAGGIVENNENKLLFIFRFGKWDLPKGKMEKNESKKETAIREVEEECGISELEIISNSYITYHVYKIKGQTILKTTYWYKMKYSGNEILIPQEEEGITKVEWLGKNELDKVFQNTYANIHMLLEDFSN